MYVAVPLRTHFPPDCVHVYLPSVHRDGEEYVVSVVALGTMPAVGPEL